MVTPNIRGLSPAQLLRQQELGALRAEQVTQEIRRRQAEDRERRQRQLAQQDRQQELADVQAQRRATLGAPRARQVAQDVLDRRQVQPAAPIERIASIPVIAPEPPPVRREEVRQLSSEEIAQRVERRQLGAGQAQAELQRRLREAPTSQIRQRVESAIQRLEPVPRDDGGTDLVAARRGGISEVKLKEEGFTQETVAAASRQATALDRLADFTDRQGNIDIDRALDRGVSTTVFRNAGIAQSDIDAAVGRQRLRSQVKDFTDRDGNIDLIEARRQGVSEKSLRDLGVEQSVIDNANRTIQAQAQLKDFTASDGSIDVISARQRGISEKTLIDAGVDKAFIEKEVRPSLNLLRKLEPFTDANGNIDINKAADKLTASELLQSDIGRKLLPDVALAKTQNVALKKLEKYKDAEGNINLAAAKRAKVSNQVMAQAGFSREDIKAANARVVAFNRLAPFAVRDEKTGQVGIDLVSAVSRRELLGGGVIAPGAKRGVNDELLRNAGFTQPQIDEAKEVARQLNPAPKTKEWYGQIGKEIGVLIADAFIPGLWARNWSKMGNKERAFNIALDGIYLVPLIGQAAKAGKGAVRAARIPGRLKSTQRALSNIRAAKAPAEIAETAVATQQQKRVLALRDRFQTLERRQQIANILDEGARVEVERIRTAQRVQRRPGAIQADPQREQIGKILDAAKDIADDQVRLAQQVKRRPGAIQEDVARKRIAAILDEATLLAKEQERTAQQVRARLGAIRPDPQRKRVAELLDEIRDIAKEQERLAQRIQTRAGAIQSRTDLKQVAAILDELKPLAEEQKRLAQQVKRRSGAIQEDAHRKEVARILDELKEVAPQQAVRRTAERLSAQIEKPLSSEERIKLFDDLVEQLRKPDVISAEARVRDAQLIKSAASIRRIVEKGIRPKDGKAAELAVLRIGEALRIGSPSRAREAAKDLQAIARRNNLPGLEDRIKSLLTEKGARQAVEFFQKAAEKAPELPKAPSDIVRRVRTPDELAKRADDRLRADEPEKGLTPQKALPSGDVSVPTRQRIAQFQGLMTAIEAGRRPPPSAKPPRRKPGPEPEAPPERPTPPERPGRQPEGGVAVKERVKPKVETRTERIRRLARQIKVVNAPQVKPTERIIKAKPKPKVEAKPTVKPKEEIKVKPGEEVKPKPKEEVRPKEEAKPKPKEEVRPKEEAKPKPKEEVKPAASPQIRTHTKVATETAVERATKTEPLPKVRTATETAVERAVQTATQRLVATRAQQAQATAVERATATKVVQAQAVAQQTATGLQTKVTTTVITTPATTTKTPTRTTTTTTVRTPTPGKPRPLKVKVARVRPPHIDLPGDAEKQLKPGEFPRVVTWRQGVTNITVDIDRGTRTFSKARGTGKGITPDESFRVLQKDKTRPTPKEFDQGVVRLNVTPRRVFFTRRRLKD